MKIIVDANIVFSGILNSNGKIGDLLVNSKKQFEFIAPDCLRVEIRKHHTRLAKISGLTLDDIIESEIQICKDITFISEEQIKPTAWVKAQELTRGIDPKDTHYVAFSKHFKCKIWSSDKVLKKGLEKKGFTNIITTDELFLLRESRK